MCIETFIETFRKIVDYKKYKNFAIDSLEYCILTTVNHQPVKIYMQYIFIYKQHSIMSVINKVFFALI